MTSDRHDRIPAGLGDGETTQDWDPSQAEGDRLQTAVDRPSRRPEPGALTPPPGTRTDPIGATIPDATAFARSMSARVMTAITQDEPPVPSASLPARLSARLRAEPAFPVPNWDRYACVRFLGEGGMGKVFLARDLRLGREVAIKFVRGDSRDHTLRLLAEARAQAQVNHERVCQVYEVDEVEGEVYIAMQYIDGVPLGALIDELTVEQKVMVVRDAAEGVHAAHRVGIVHRDLNPNNIMVERDPDGRQKAYVMDFGLARDRKEGGTETGTVMGTPHYMAPEQARGEVGRLDRRADIYSLGASLYLILTRVQPIPGDNGLEVLANIPTVEPTRPRKIDPDIPADLEAITLKCLEKNRSARYDSARALAEDLGRFLDGEPVQASRAGLAYRLRKRMKKHRRPLAVAVIVVALLGAALAWGLNARREGQSARREAIERERLARRFTERVEQIEATLRYSALAPLHDIRADHAEVRARMAELKADIEEAGPIARGPGHYALGRGALALGDRAAARRELEAAWQAGYREPRVAYALALVLGAEYQQQLAEAERVRNDEQREARKRVIERDYRDPALDYLRQSGNAAEVPSSEYVAALIAFYENRFDDALARLDAIGSGLPWFYEAPALRGTILVARGVQASRAGDRERALADFEAGRRAYAAAAAIGESVPELYADQANLENAALRLNLYEQADVDPPFQRGLAAIARALTASPDHVRSLIAEARLCRSMAEFRGSRGVAVEDLLARAIAATERAVAVDPDDSLAWLDLSLTYWQLGEDRQRNNQDPSAELAKAVAASDRVAESDRSADFFLGRGLIFKVWADYQDSVGVESQANRGHAIMAFTSGLELAPRAVGGLINLGGNYYQRALQPRSPDPDGDLQAAAAALDRALEVNPRHAIALYYQGNVHEQIALRAWARGGDPGPELARALERYRAGIEVNPGLPHLHNGAGTILLEQAIATWDLGGDPEPLLVEARAAYDRAIAAAPDQVFGHNNRAEVSRRRAEFQRNGGADPRAAAREAARAFAQVAADNPDDPRWLVNVARTHVLLAVDALERGADAVPSLAAAEAALTKALAQSPSDGDSRLAHALVLGARAQARARRGQGRDADFAAAAAELERGLALAPDDQDSRVQAGHFHRAWAGWLLDTGRDPGAPLVRGLAVANELLSARPAWAVARALRASLHLVEAQTAATPVARRDAARRAADDFEAAFATNANLEKKWRSQAALAQQLAGT